MQEVIDQIADWPIKMKYSSKPNKKIYILCNASIIINVIEEAL